MDTPSRSAVATHSLVERCRLGDREAWRDLVEEYSRYVYAIIMRGYRLSDSDAEDVFQDVFARVFERLATLRDDDALRGWIAQVTRNLCSDHLRRSHPTEELSDETVTDLDERLADLDMALAVRPALVRLPERGPALRASGSSPPRRPAPTPSTGSSAATSPTARSRPSSTCPPAPSRAGSAAASTGWARGAVEDTPPRPRLGG